MHFIARLTSLAALLLLSLGLGCQSANTSNYSSTALTTGSAKENQRDFTIDAAGGSYAVSLYPKTYGALAGPAFSLVIVSPVLLSDEVLVNSGNASLIPWFNARGIAVWLVRIPRSTNLEKFGRDVLPSITSAIRKNSTDTQWVMAGVSLGGQAVAQYLNEAPKNATVSGMLVKAAFFLGTGFDYAYPGSFTSKLLQKQGQNLCQDEFCTRFFPGLKSEFVSPRSALTDAAGKPVWRETLENISLGGKGVRMIFVAGKIDNVAPSESVYKFFVKTIGDETKNSPDVRFFLAGRMNRYARDYDHTTMFASKDLASELLPEILKWIDL